MSSPAGGAQIGARTAHGCPVTALTHLPGTDWALAGAGRQLSLVSLNPRPTRRDCTWTVFQRERVHRIVLAEGRQASGGYDWRVLVVGGKEAVLISFELGISESGADLHVGQRFLLDDFAGDGAFLDDDQILLSTLHNSIHVYPLSPRLPSPSTSSTCPPLPLTSPLYTLHASLRPTLWCTRFDRAHYRSSASVDSAGQDRIRLAGGSLWGDTFLWELNAARESAEKARAGTGVESGRREEMAREGSLRRLAGHKGAVFTASFSPCTRFLVTGSDDRTLRVWDLSLLAVPDPSAPDSSSDADAVPHLALWGHSARVWRAAFVPSSPSLPPSRAPRLDRSGPSPPAPPTVPLHIASVAEDGTARLWRVSPSALARPPSSARDAGKSAKGYALVATFRDGHDGRSLWAVAPALLPSGRTVTLTGGANGAVRCWAVPRGEVGLLALLAEDGKEAGAQREGKGKEPKVKAFVAAPLEGEAGEGGRDLAVVLHDDGTFAAYPPSASLASPPIPFHSSPAWSGLSACTLRLLPSPSSGGFTLLASSNRGLFLHATLSCAGALVGAVSEWETGVRAADVHVGEVDASGKGEVAVWDRAGWRVVLLEVDEASVRERPPTILASLALTATSPTTAPTALHLLSPTLLLLGAASGSLSLFRISDQTLSPLCSTERAHEDGIAHLAACATDRARGEWTVASVGRDGARCVLHVEVDEARGAARMELQDRRVLSKGSLEEIVHVGSKEEIYLALVEGRAALLDRLGQQLHSFVGAGPSKKVPFQLVRAQDGSLRYYRLVAGQLLVQSVSSAASLPVPILRSGLHGREIRTLEVMRTADGTSLVATAAENGVLSVSKLHSSKHLDPLFTARHLPSALKALAWSSPPRSSTSPALLFACGARELLCAYSLSYSPAGDGELHVLPCGQVLAPEGGEVRAMDLAVAQLEAGDDGQERSVVVVGYSDGSLRLWLHDAAAASFSLVVRSQEEGKCLLQVELVEVDLREGGRRWIAVTSASDGLLALRDVSSFVNANPPDRSSLPPPFFSFHPHQSGINALALSLSGSTLLVATGGDDNALSVARVTLCLSPLANGDGSRLVAQLGTQASLDDVHASTITGLDFLSPSLLASSSVEQRLNLYALSSTSEALHLRLQDSTVLDVADCGAQAVLPVSKERAEALREARTVLLAGIGVEAVDVHSRAEQR